MVTRLYQLGLSVSYARILEIEDWLPTSVSERFEEDNCVCPPNLKKGLFSVAALDNIDHNPSSTTASSSFHGTSISIFQFPTQDKHGDCRPPLTVPPTGNQKYRLPESYGNVPSVSLTATTVSVPITNQLSSFDGNLDPAIAQENAWLEHGQQKLQGTLTSTDKIAWAAYQHSPIVDIVWDAYTPDSLKESTWEKRGLGVQREVAGKTELPPNWSQFLRDPANKTELFGFLSSKVAGASVPAGKALHITSGKCGHSCRVTPGVLF